MTAFKSRGEKESIWTRIGAIFDSICKQIITCKYFKGNVEVFSAYRVCYNINFSM